MNQRKGNPVKFKCNLCPRDNPDVSPYTCTAIDWDAGMTALQQHINAFHGGGEAVAQDVTINIKVR